MMRMTIVKYASCNQNNNENQREADPCWGKIVFPAWVHVSAAVQLLTGVLTLIWWWVVSHHRNVPSCQK